MNIEGVSSQPADAAPPAKKKRGCWKFLGYILVAFIAVSVFGAVINGMRTTGILPTATPRPTPTVTPTPAPTPTWEEWKRSAEEIPYEDLFRYAEQHVGKIVYYRAKIVQVIEHRDSFELRANVTPGEYGFWDDTVFLRYPDAPVRVLEDDIVEFVGRMNGNVTYESIMGANITLPHIIVFSLRIEQ